jgi:hypothetical protein
MKNLNYTFSICFLILLYGCYKEKTAPSNEVIISMTGNHTFIPADGVSRQLITIEIPPTTADANNNITLTTSKGLFDIANKNTITVAAQNVTINDTLHKIASVNLISSTDEGTAYVTATIKNYSQVDTITFRNGFIMSMTGNQTSIPADGVSKQLITIEIPPTTIDANNSIALTTSKGLFDVVNKNTTTVVAQNVSVNGVLHKIASINLISSNDTGTAYVTASIKNYSQADTVKLTNAFAEQIKISVDKLNYQISNTGEVTVTVKISRFPGHGTPTPSQNITLVAMDSTQNPSHQVGRFRNFTTLTDASGSCVNYFSIPLTNPYTGKVKLFATAPTDILGNFISDSTTIITY